MATRFFFRSMASNDNTGGTRPTGEVSTDTDSFTSSPAAKNTPLTLALQKGDSATSIAGTYNSGSSPLYSMMGMFVSDDLLPGQTITGGQTLTIGIGQTESNNQMNLYFRHFIYIRSSAGSNSKTILTPTSDPSEEGTNRLGCVHTFTSAETNYTTVLGDRIVHEVWADIRNTRATNYTATFYYNGATDMTEGNASTDEASYVQFNDDLRLVQRINPGVNFL